MNTAVSVRIPDALIQQLDNMVKTTEKTRGFHVQKALEAYLEEQADLQIVFDRLHDTSDQILSLEEMRKEITV